MKVHEYQAKDLLARHGAPVPGGRAATSVEEAVAAARELPGALWVVKCQVHAGGRGKGKLVDAAAARRIAAEVEVELKAGAKGSPGALAVQKIEAQKLARGKGVALARSESEVRSLAQAALGRHLVTIQTGAAGQPVSRLLIAAGIEIAQDPRGSQLTPGQAKDFEVYLALTVDRERQRVVLLASREGGVEIETVAARKPELLFKEWLDPLLGLTVFQANRIASGMGLDKEQAAQFVTLARAAAECFAACDASIVEINPAVFTLEGRLLALDAKINFDDNGLERHPDLQALRDLTEEDPNEQKAKDAGLSYVKLDGDIGCLVNGAGLAMATMDIILAYGGEPANFLDVGGGASAEQVETAFGIILSDPHVKAVLINIFGGILLCDRLATGVVAAARKVGLKVPLVVRMEGNRVAEGKKILGDSGLPIITADSMGEAGRKVVAAARG